MRRLPIWPAIVLAAVGACNEVTTAPPTPSNEPAQVEILLDDFQLLVGNERALSAEVRSAGGTVLSTQTQWVSDNATVATVGVTGVVRGVGEGQARIFATAGAALDSIDVTVPEPTGSAANPGATIVTLGGTVRLVVPLNALQVETDISIVLADQDSLPSGSTALDGSAFEFAPAGLEFLVPATLTIHYNRGLTTSREALRLRLHKLEGGAWTPIEGSTVDTVFASVTGDITSFSIYGVVPIPNHSPTATITSPTNGAELGWGESVAFTGTGTDPEEGPLSGASLTWSSSLDGELGTGVSVVVSDLSMGEHVVSLTAADAEGTTGVAEIGVTVVDGPPVMQILQPSADTVVKVFDAVVFKGSATDHVDGSVPDSVLTWTSSIDGALGTGDSISAPSMSLGDHVITLSATDSQGQSGTASVTVTVSTNSPPVATITAPNDGASVGDVSGTSLHGTAEDPEDGTLSGASLVWSSNVDGTLGTGAAVGVSGLTVGAHVIKLTATDSHGATDSETISITVFDEPPELFRPVLKYIGEVGGTLELSVTNRSKYDQELFELDPTGPLCGANPNRRTWVEVYDGDGALLTTFCDFDTRSDMASMTFTPATPPAEVYIELWDRVGGQRIASNSVVPVPSAPTIIAGVVANDRDEDLNTLDPGEALSGVTLELIVDTNADGVIDAGEVVWATTKTNGSGGYTFSGLWQRNYIVRAQSTSKATVLRALSATGDVMDQTGTLLTTAVVGAGATLNQSGTEQVGNTDPPSQGDELPRWDYTAGTAAADTGLEPSGPGPNSMNAALTSAPAHFIFLYSNGSLTGSVTSGGAGVAGVRVIAVRCRTAGSAPVPPVAGSCLTTHGSPPQHIKQVDTNASGVYTVNGLLEGVYQIEVVPQTVGMDNVVTPGAPGRYLAVLKGDGDGATLPDFVIN